MDAEVKNEEMTDNGQIPILIEPKQEVEESWGFIEPKIELIDVIDVKKEEIDDSEYQHIIPYEYRDYLEQHADNEEQPTNSRKRPADDSSMPERNSSECQKCGATILINHMTNAKIHALRHTNLKLYKCPAKRCKYRSFAKQCAITHLKRQHKSCTDPVIINEMSDGQIQELKDMMHECFPHLPSRDVVCQLCHQKVNDSVGDKIEHSNGHINPLLFKCDEQDCDFSTNFFASFSRHLNRNHWKFFKPNDRKLQLAKEQMTIRKWNDMCFGDLSKEDPIETVDYPAPIPFMSRRQNKHFCQICQKEVKEASCGSQEKQRNHALEHVDIMLYKCSVPDCQVQTKDQNAMIDHEVTIHDLLVAFSGKCKIPLTTTQINETEKMFIQCFPESSKKDML